MIRSPRNYLLLYIEDVFFMGWILIPMAEIPKLSSIKDFHCAVLNFAQMIRVQDHENFPLRGSLFGRSALLFGVLDMETPQSCSFRSPDSCDSLGYPFAMYGSFLSCLSSWLFGTPWRWSACWHLPWLFFPWRQHSAGFPCHMRKKHPR